MSSTLPLGIRCNNPWNLQQEHIDWLGLAVDQAPSGELVFETLSDGIRAGVLLCYSYQKGGYNTALKFIMRFAPASAGNPTSVYVENVCTWCGITFDQTLDFHDQAFMLKWARAIFRQEQGAQASVGITDTQISQGIALAEGD